MNTIRLIVPLLFAALLATADALATPTVQHWQSTNGARVYFVPSPDLPMVDIRVVFNAGSARDGASPGISGLVNALIDEGAAGRGAGEIATAFEGVGAEQGSGALRDMAWLSLRSLTDPQYLEPALATFESLLTAPDFPIDAVERERQRALAGLKSRAQEPGSIAQDAFYAALYGDHPYASPVEGTEAALSGVSRDALLAFHRRYYVAGNATIAIVGALSSEQALAVSERLTRTMPAGHAAPALPPVPAPKAGLINIPFPSTQAHILIGQPGVRRGDEDYYALYMANHVLGGSGFSSRLVEEIREQRGLAYSVASYFSPMAAEGPFRMTMQTKLAKSGEAIALLRDGLAQFHREGPSEEELDHARRNVVGGFALRMDSNSELVQLLAVIGFYQLPLDYLDYFLEQARSLERAQIVEAFRRRVTPEQLVTVVVGPKLESSAEAR